MNLGVRMQNCLNVEFGNKDTQVPIDRNQKPAASTLNPIPYT